MDIWEKRLQNGRKCLEFESYVVIEVILENIDLIVSHIVLSVVEGGF